MESVETTGMVCFVLLPNPGGYWPSLKSGFLTIVKKLIGGRLRWLQGAK